MQVLVAYYSYSGNTKKVAKVLAEILSQKGRVREEELLALDESKSFLGQCRRAFRHKRAKIREVNFDLSRYDLICLGTPIWAFASAPALNGSGAGRDRCLFKQVNQMFINI